MNSSSPAKASAYLSATKRRVAADKSAFKNVTANPQDSDTAGLNDSINLVFVI